MATLLNSSWVFILVGNGAKEHSPLPTGAVEGDYRYALPQAESAGGGRHMGPTARTLITGGITITKESQVLSKLYPQASEEQRGQGARGQMALRIATKKRGKDLCTYS